MNVNLLFRDHLAIQKRLNGESPGTIKGHIGEEADVVCIALRLYPKLGWRRGCYFPAIRSQHAHMRLKFTYSNPVIRDRQFQDHRGESGKEKVFENSHKRQLVPHLDSDIVTSQAVYELSCSH